MDRVEDHRQRGLSTVDPIGGDWPPGLLADLREDWEITQGYITTDSKTICPTCRQYETLELAFGGNDISEYKCSNCGAQVRYEEEEN